MTAGTERRIPPSVAVPLIQDRAQRLAADMRARRISPQNAALAVESIAADLAAIVDQAAPEGVSS